MSAVHAGIRDERGAALLVALATMAIISILGVSALVVASGSVNLTVWDQSSNQAFQVAEGGFNQALARARAGTLEDGGDFTAYFPDGEASVVVTPLTGFIFSITSTGGSPTLDEPKARRAVQGAIISIDPKHLIFANSSQGLINGNVTIYGPFYVRDILSLSGDAAFFKGPLFIKDAPATLNPTGDLVLGGSSSVGTAGEPIIVFVDGAYPAASPNFHASAVYTDVPDLKMPAITGADMPDQRAAANVVIDNDGDTDGDTPLNLDKNAPTQTYGSYPGGNYLRWTNPGGNNKTRTLEVKGTVFVDGAVSLGASQITDIKCPDTGTIIANGNIAVNSQFRPDPVPSPKDDWPDGTAMGLVTPYQIDMDPKTGDDMFAVLYAYEQISFVNQQYFYGTAITQLLLVNNNPHLYIADDISDSEMPPGMPPVEAQTFVSGWREVKP